MIALSDGHGDGRVLGGEATGMIRLPFWPLTRWALTTCRGGGAATRF